MTSSILADVSMVARTAVRLRAGRESLLYQKINFTLCIVYRWNWAETYIHAAAIYFL
jgi:hypothetical protein